MTDQNPNVLPVFPPYSGDPFDRPAAYVCRCGATTDTPETFDTVGSPCPVGGYHAWARNPGPPYAPSDAVAPEPQKWTCEQPPSKFLLTLNGFDEIAITGRFGAPILALRDDPIAGGRAMAFVHMRRLGMNDPDAYAACMELTMQGVMDYFHPEAPKADAPPASAEGNAQ